MAPTDNNPAESQTTVTVRADGWTETVTETERRLTSPDGKTTLVYDK